MVIAQNPHEDMLKQKQRFRVVCVWGVFGGGGRADGWSADASKLHNIGRLKSIKLLSLKQTAVSKS